MCTTAENPEDGATTLKPSPEVEPERKSTGLRTQLSRHECCVLIGSGQPFQMKTSNDSTNQCFLGHIAVE